MLSTIRGSQTRGVMNQSHHRNLTDKRKKDELYSTRQRVVSSRTSRSEMESSWPANITYTATPSIVNKPPYPHRQKKPQLTTKSPPPTGNSAASQLLLFPSIFLPRSLCSKTKSLPAGRGQHRPGAANHASSGRSLKEDARWGDFLLGLRDGDLLK